ncbi:MAG: DUF3313 family protein [Pseudomonadota bacterium]
MINFGFIKVRGVATALGLVLLGACAPSPTIQTGADAETTLDGALNKVDNTAVDLAYVDPDADYGRYTKVWVTPLDLDNVEIEQPSSNSSILNRYNEEWELTDDDKVKLQEAFANSMQRELTRNGDFAAVSSGGDDVIVVEAMITKIAPSAPKDDTASRGMGRSRVFTQGAGGMAIAIVLADGDSGEVLAIIKDARSSENSNWGLNDSVTNMADVKRNFNTWALRIHKGLLGLKQRASSAEA